MARTAITVCGTAVEIMWLLRRVRCCTPLLVGVISTCDIAEMPDAIIMDNIGRAMRKSGRLETVQYRNSPTFLVKLVYIIKREFEAYQ